jgi:methanethiol S-methyltransferase
MKATLSVVYALSAYLLFLGTILYAIGFVANVAVPKTIDSGVLVPPAEALFVNASLLALFAVQHSVMARPAFKRWWTRFVPHALERSTFVVFASLTLLLLFWQWRPMPATIWHVTTPFLALLLQVLSFAGWGFLVASTFLMNHFELFGLSQAFAPLLDGSPSPQTFKTPLIYRHVRHPMYLCFLIAFWCTPHMTAGHLLFSIGTTGYIVIGIRFEERDLIATFGDQYRRYRSKVGMLLPRPGSHSSERPSEASSHGRSTQS